MKRAARRLCLLALSLPVMAVCLPAVSDEPSAVAEKAAAPTPFFNDYTSVLPFAQTAGAAQLRHPAPAEIQRLGPLWPQVPWYRNAASYYLKALALAKAVETRNAGSEAPGTFDGEKPYAGDKKALEDWVNRFRPALRVMAEGLRFDYCQPPVFMTTDTLATTPPRVRTKLPWSIWPMDVRKFAAYCADAAFVDELNGNYYRAGRWHARCLRMMTQIRRSGDELRSIEAVNGASVALCELHRLISSHNLPEDMLHEIIGQCLASESLSDELPKMWEREKARLDDIYGAFDFGTGPGAAPAWQEMRTRLAKQYPGMTPPKDYGELRDDLDHFESKVADAFRRPLEDLASDKPGAEALRRDLFPDTSRSFLAGIYSSVITAAPELYACADVRLREEEVQAAVILYQKHLGKLPEKLDDLVPDFLPIVPEDPFAKAPLKFARTDYGWKVWSVGPNHVDDGGKGLDALSSTRLDIVLRSKVETNEQRRSGFRLVEENGQLVLKKRS